MPAMPEGVYLAFDFGFKRIGLAVGQRLTCSANPLHTIAANQGQPDWAKIEAAIKEWRPEALVVGYPTAQDGSELYTTGAVRGFVKQLKKKYALPVHLEDERLTTKAVKEELHALGGYRKIRQSQVDSLAACLILEQWLRQQP